MSDYRPNLENPDCTCSWRRPHLDDYEFGTREGGHLDAPKWIRDRTNGQRERSIEIPADLCGVHGVER